MEIYLARNGQRFGPYPVEVLNAYLAEGKITPEDLAWAPDQQAWMPLKVVLEKLPPSTDAAETGAGLDVGPLPDPEPEEAPTLSTEMPSTPLAAEKSPPIIASTSLLRAAWSPRGARLAVAGVFLIGAVVVLAKLPDHASIAVTDHVFLRVDEGYAFVDPYDSWNWDVQWVPGTPSTTQAHMLAGSESDTWRPAPGYTWLSTEPASQDPVWAPQKREPEFPHVIAGFVPDTWIPDPGYVLTGSATPISPSVEWRSGVSLPHMKSSERENYWTLDPGYVFALDSAPEHPKVSWSPGARHYGYPHVFADTQESRWLVDPGYTWLKPEVTDLRTFSPGRTWEAWSLASDIDAATQGINCSSDAAILAVIESTRDRYHALDMSDVHPFLAQHFAATEEALSSGASTINTCFVVDHAEGGADLLAAGLCWFSDKSWQECMDDSKTARKLIGVASELGSIPCGQALEGFGTRLDELAAERRQLHEDFRAQYTLQLRPSARLVSCQ